MGGVRPGGDRAVMRGVVAQQRTRSAPRRRRRRAIAEELARQFGGVVTRQELLRADVTHEDIRTELRAGVWHRAGAHTLSIDAREPHDHGLFWRAVWESGPRAVLDGVSALIWCGLKGWTESGVCVSVPHNATVRAVPGIRHHFLRDLGRVDRQWLPHTVAEVAVVRAAQWARSETAAATVLAMSVQQKMAAPVRVMEHWSSLRSPFRREFLDVVIKDICDGAQSLNELDVARLCRARGLPEPTRQKVRTGRNGRVYLDVYWEEYGVHLEIQGAHHYQGLAGVGDALRSNEQAIRHSDDIQLQLPVLGLRTRPGDFLDQIAEALAAGARRRLPRGGRAG